MSAQKRFTGKFNLVTDLLIISAVLYATPAIGTSRLAETIDTQFQPTATALDPAFVGLGHQFRLDLDETRQTLAQAPLETSQFKQAPAQLTLPLPNGQEVVVNVIESPLMEVPLAKRFPQIRSYALQGADNEEYSGRLMLSQLGITGILLTPEGVVQIRPLNEGEADSDYLSVLEHHVVHDDGQFCGFSDPVNDFNWTLTKQTHKDDFNKPVLQLASGDELRTYRLAVATTGEYYAGRGGNDADVLASIMTEVGLVNAIYESEVAIRLVLIANNDDLLFTDPMTDGYSNTQPCTMRGENVTVINATIDEDDYDVGHVFGTSPGGGCAGGSVVCGGQKGNGASGLNVGNAVGHNGFGGYRLVLHEIGHQFGASHVWSGVNGNCTPGQFAPNSAYENGGGTTIMAYSGTCGSDNIQGSTVDTYFNSHSFEQITAFSTSGGGNDCPTISNTGNTAPVVDAGPDYTIPQGTPFVLTGSAIDAEGDPLTYAWEQHDLSNPAAQKALDVDDGSGPIFRSFPPVTTPERTFPQISDVLNNTQTPGEILPSTDRGLEFRLTARDNRAAGGGVDWDTVNLTVQGDPFFINSPNGGEVLFAGCPVDVSWTVGGGSVADSVDLLYSLDNGASFPTSLLNSVDNDGAVTVPALPCDTGMARFRLNAVGNIFFDISDNPSFVNQSPPDISVDATGGEVDENCEFEVQFQADVVDDCGISAATVDVQVFQQMMNFDLGAPQFMAQQVDPTTVAVSGSVLVSNLTSSPATLAIEVSAEDLCGAPADNYTEVMVVDTIPPEIEVSVTPDSLWPPNHRMRTITADVTVSDNCPVVDFVMSDINSNEPDNGKGDGNTTNDIQNADVGTPDLIFDVRAERQGKGNGRIYTVTYTAEDGSGNTADDSATITVPHNR